MMRKAENNINFIDLNEGLLVVGSLLSLVVAIQPQATQNTMKSITSFLLSAPKACFGLFNKETPRPHEDKQEERRILFIR